MFTGSYFYDDYSDNAIHRQCYDEPILITKTTAARSEVALSYHKVRGLNFLTVLVVMVGVVNKLNCCRYCMEKHMLDSELPEVTIIPNLTFQIIPPAIQIKDEPEDEPPPPPPQAIVIPYQPPQVELTVDVHNPWYTWQITPPPRYTGLITPHPGILG